MQLPTILVVAGVLIEGHRVLVTQRPPGVHLSGLWEFPGGKVEPDEDPRAAIVRELHEELGVCVEAGQVLDVCFHRYPNKSTIILFFTVRRINGSPAPRPLQVAAVQWRTHDQLPEHDFPPADVAVLETVRMLLTSPSS